MIINFSDKFGILWIHKFIEFELRGTLLELAAHYKQTPPKGEIVLVVEGKNEK